MCRIRCFLRLRKFKNKEAWLVLFGKVKLAQWEKELLHD